MVILLSYDRVIISIYTIESATGSNAHGTWHLHYLHACIYYNPNVVQNHA